VEVWIWLNVEFIFPFIHFLDEMAKKQTHIPVGDVSMSWIAVEPLYTPSIYANFDVIGCPFMDVDPTTSIYGKYRFPPSTKWYALVTRGIWFLCMRLFSNRWVSGCPLPFFRRMFIVGWSLHLLIYTWTHWPLCLHLQKDVYRLMLKFTQPHAAISILRFPITWDLS